MGVADFANLGSVRHKAPGHIGLLPAETWRLWFSFFFSNRPCVRLFSSVWGFDGGPEIPAACRGVVLFSLQR